MVGENLSSCCLVDVPGGSHTIDSVPLHLPAPQGCGERFEEEPLQR